MRIQKSGLSKEKKWRATEFNLPPALMKEKKAFEREKETLEKDPLESVPYGKKIVFTSIFWLFIIVMLPALYLPDVPLLLPLFYVSLLLSVGFAIFGKGYSFYLFPASLRKWHRNTRLVAAYHGPEGAWTSDGLRGLTLLQQIPSFLLVTSFFPFFLGLMIFENTLYTPILNLDQMNLEIGTVERVINIKGRRSYSKSKLKMRTLEGDLLIFRGFTKEDCNYLKALNKDELITAWWQPEWSFIPRGGLRKRLWQLKHDDRYLHKYDKIRVLRVAEFGKKVFYICLAYIIFSIGICWVVGNQYLKDK